MMLRRRAITLAAIATGSALVLTGCTGGDSGGGAASAAAGDGSVTIAGAFTGDQGSAFQTDLDAWAADKGIEVEYQGSDSFETSIVAQVRGGTAPDVAIFPQPGVLKSLIRNDMVPLDDMIDVAAATEDEAAGLPDIAKVNGQTYGLPYNINVKSLVWYNPAAFEDAGLEVPTTDDELVALQQQIIDDQLGYPWCVGIASQGSTGWPMTDWLEEYVLRYGGLEKYNQWISHEIPFDSPLVRQAAAKVESTLFVDGAVAGGGEAMAATDFGAAGNNLFNTGGIDDNQCFMMRQGTFITGFFPDDIQAEIADGNTDNINAFVLPTPSDAAAVGTLGGGDIVSAFTNDSDVQQVVEYLVGPEFGTNGYAENWGSALSPHSTFDADLYTTPFQPIAAKAVADAEVFGFDASDQMPGAVGAGTEWSNLTEWTSGQISLDEALANIDESWPQ